MTRTAPWRRMILHFSHIGLTDGRTFMVPFGCCLYELGSGRRCRLPLPIAELARAGEAPEAHEAETIARRFSQRPALVVVRNRITEATKSGE